MCWLYACVVVLGEHLCLLYLAYVLAICVGIVDLGAHLVIKYSYNFMITFNVECVVLKYLNHNTPGAVSAVICVSGVLGVHIKF